MRVIECSMCRRRAAWLIDREVFCEGHKEIIVQEARRRSLSDTAAHTSGTRLSLRRALFAVHNPEEGRRQRRWPKPFQFTLNP